MINAAAIQLNMTRLAGRIALRERNPAVPDAAIEKAFAELRRRYPHLVAQGFDARFVRETGLSIVQRYLDNDIERVDAAVALAAAWEVSLTPVNGRERKRRLADAAMAADSLLSGL